MEVMNMEYTLQLTDEIALQKDDLATYEGCSVAQKMAKRCI